MIPTLKHLLASIKSNDDYERLIKEAMAWKYWIIGGVFVFLLLVLYILENQKASSNKSLVPAGEEWVMEKGGKYRQTLQEGDMWHKETGNTLRAVVNITNQTIEIAAQNIFGADNLCFYTNGAKIVFHVDDSQKAVYAVGNYLAAINKMADEQYFDVISKQKTPAVIRNKRGIAQLLKNRLIKESEAWGITIDDVILHDITVAPDVFKRLAANNLECLIKEQKTRSQSKMITTIAKAIKNSGDSAAKYVLANKNLDNIIGKMGKGHETANRQLEGTQSVTDVEHIFEPQEGKKENHASHQATLEHPSEK